MDNAERIKQLRDQVVFLTRTAGGLRQVSEPVPDREMVTINRSVAIDICETLEAISRKIEIVAADIQRTSSGA